MATTFKIGTFFQENPVISGDGLYVVFEQSSQIILRELNTGELTTVSVSSEGVEGNRASGFTDSAAISADGRYVAFTSDATNLVPNDTNGEPDLFLRDTVEGTTRLISLNADGNQVSANSFDSALRPSISADGRFVAFQTEASLANDGFRDDIFVRDTVENTTELISISSDGVPSDGSATGASISADGRFVAFTSLGNDLVANDTSIDFDVFVRDRQEGTTIMASVNSQGEEASGSDVESNNAVMSPDGSYVIFRSTATNLVPNDTNGVSDIFRHDLTTGETTRVSVDSDGNQSNGGSSLAFAKSAISADGRYIVFQSVANNLVEGDTNNALDVFVRDTVEETTTRVSVNAEGEEPVGGLFGTESFGGTISGDGNRIAFMSNGRNMNDDDIDTPLIYLRQFVVNTEEDEIPIVSNPLSDISVEEGAENQTIDLSDVFSDADEDEITVTVQSNSNSELVIATITDNNLTLDFAEDRSGTAEITIRATANEQTVDDTFIVTVEEGEEDEIPVVSNPLSDITVEEGAENQTIDLSDVFNDADEDEITVTVQSNSNSELVTATITDNNLNLDFAEDRSGTAEITIRATANEQTVDDTFSITVEEGESDEPEQPDEPNLSDETIELFRFRNTSFDTGTYVFVGEQEKDDILADENLSNTFSLDGEQDDGTVNPAFTASATPGDDLISFYRLKSLDVLGTFLFVAQQEYDDIFADDSNQKNKWEKEGFNNEGEDVPEFYLLPPVSDAGTTFNRYQNTENGTFLYAGEAESQAIDSDSNLSNIFTNQGGAFNSLV